MIPKVREWLEKQGYSLEMRAASAFRKAGLEVRQSSYYIDPETAKPREMDVEAISTSFLGYVDIRFFVECKSGDKPWVLLCSPDTLRNYNRFFAFCAMSRRCREVLTEEDLGSGLIHRYPWLSTYDVIAAYSLRQAFSSELDSAYAAAMNVIKACHYHVAAQYTPPSHLHFAFPVIVVDTPLIRCTLGANGEIELQEVEQGELLFRGHKLGTCIRIVTLSHLSAFASEAKQVAEQLREELRGEEEKMIATMEQATKQHGG